MTRTVPHAIEQGAMRETAQPCIRIDDRLELRPWRLDDAPAVVAAFGVPDIVRWHARRMTGRDEAEKWIDSQQMAWAEERSASFAIVDRADDSVLGRTALHTDLEHGQAEIAYWILPHARRQDVAARAGRAATAWGHQFGFHRIELEHSTANHASCRVARRLGYAVEGVRREAVLHADGWHDMHLHAHLAIDPDD